MTEEEEFIKRLKEQRKTIKAIGAERRPEVFDGILKEAHELYGDEPRNNNLNEFIDFVNKEAYPDHITTKNSLAVDREQAAVKDAESPAGFLSQLFLGLDERGRSELPEDVLRTVGTVVASPFTIPYGITDKMYSGGKSFQNAVNEELGTEQIINAVAGQASGLGKAIQGKPSGLTQEQKNLFEVLALTALTGKTVGPIRSQVAKRGQFKKNFAASKDATTKTFNAANEARRSDVRAKAKNADEVVGFTERDGNLPSQDTISARIKQAEAANLATDAAVPNLNSMNRLGRIEVTKPGAKRSYLNKSLEDRVLQDKFLRDNLTNAELFSSEINTILSDLDKFKGTK